MSTLHLGILHKNLHFEVMLSPHYSATLSALYIITVYQHCSRPLTNSDVQNTGWSRQSDKKYCSDVSCVAGVCSSLGFLVLYKTFSFHWPLTSEPLVLAWSPGLAFPSTRAGISINKSTTFPEVYLIDCRPFCFVSKVRSSFKCLACILVSSQCLRLCTSIPLTTHNVCGQCL